jgi:hypothetical protein
LKYSLSGSIKMKLVMKLAKVMTKKKDETFVTNTFTGVTNKTQRHVIENPNVLGMYGITDNFLEKISKASNLDKPPFNSQSRLQVIIGLEKALKVISFFLSLPGKTVVV